MRGYGNGNRSSKGCLKDAASVAIRSCVVGAVLGGLLGVVVWATEYGYSEMHFAASLGMWGLGGAAAAVVMGVAVSIAGAAYAIFRDFKTDGGIVGARSRARSRQSRRFWRAYWASFPIAAGLSLFPLWKTHGMWPGCCCCKHVGWPVAFYTLGGDAPRPHYSFPNLTTDVAIWLGGAILAGLLMRYGVYRLGVKTFQILRGRLQGR